MAINSQEHSRETGWIVVAVAFHCHVYSTVESSTYVLECLRLFGNCLYSLDRCMCMVLSKHDDSTTRLGSVEAA